MLHLQVSHLKIPIHYIVYGKITPFTEQYATFFATFLNVCPVWMCFARGMYLKSAGPWGVFRS